MGQQRGSGQGRRRTRRLGAAEDIPSQRGSGQAGKTYVFIWFLKQGTPPKRGAAERRHEAAAGGGGAWRCLPLAWGQRPSTRAMPRRAWGTRAYKHRGQPRCRAQNMATQKTKRREGRRGKAHTNSAHGSSTTRHGRESSAVQTQNKPRTDSSHRKQHSKNT